MALIPYITFSGSCREAITFYQKALGAEILYSMTFAEMPPRESGEQQEGCAATVKMAPDDILHASLRIAGCEIMISDGAADNIPHHGYALNLMTTDVEEGKRWFQNLAVGGHITMPWQETFWAFGFGMVTDRFGIHWMVNIAKPAE
jgi:PhnB protein